MTVPREMPAVAPFEREDVGTDDVEDGGGGGELEVMDALSDEDGVDDANDVDAAVDISVTGADVSLAKYFANTPSVGVTILLANPVFSHTFVSEVTNAIFPSINPI